MDGPFESHLSKQRELNGSIDSCGISIIWSECQYKDGE